MKRFFITTLFFLIAVYSFTSVFVSCGSNKEKTTVFRVARDKSFYPLHLMGKENNLLAFVDEVLFEIAEIQHLRIDLVTNDHGNLVFDLIGGDYDAIVTFEDPSPKLESNFYFSDLFFPMGTVLIVQQDSPIHGVADLKNKVLGIERGSDVTKDIPAEAHSIFTSYEDILIGLRSLASGQIDAVLMNTIPAYEFTQSFYHTLLKVLWPPINNEGIRLQARKNENTKEFIAHFNEGLDKLKKNGTIDKLIRKWNLLGPEFNQPLFSKSDIYQPRENR